MDQNEENEANEGAPNLRLLLDFLTENRWQIVILAAILAEVIAFVWTGKPITL